MRIVKQKISSPRLPRKRCSSHDGVQYKLINAILALNSDPNVYILGDDDQSIYAFRFAYPKGIQLFQEQYPDVQDYTLIECFRCTPSILKEATKLIKLNSPNSRLPKNLVPKYSNLEGLVRRFSFSSEVSEAKFIAESCHKLVDAGVSPDNILILYHVKSQRSALEKAFSEIDGIDASIQSTGAFYFEYS